MSSALYNIEILRLAASIPHLGRLAQADGTAERRSPLCGSRVAVDVRCVAGRLSDLGLDVSSCALGQASAHVMAAAAIGQRLENIRSGEAALRALLANGDAGMLPNEWRALDIFARARDYPARHAALLLPFEAAAQAMEQALARQGDI